MGYTYNTILNKNIFLKYKSKSYHSNNYSQFSTSFSQVKRILHRIYIDLVIFVCTKVRYLTRLEEENSNLTKIKVDKVLRLMGDIRTEVTSNNAMPSGVVLLVELLLNVSSNILLDVIFVEGDSSASDSVLLHLFTHISILNDGLTFSTHNLQNCERDTMCSVSLCCMSQLDTNISRFDRFNNKNIF